ncbi:SymE family type I addiction module toxin [Xenorhabdus griffiniae]|uniref:SymE family type I addiction module toxin n=1 Tax=Xenorhabdus griffiniae TaxID=351672 RepID=A0ABY9XFD9_9GAMM|nr:SymE family type I addiction module toxin [Xenorhabdus griffiniae]WMV71638.1 SymE family type I addiction module toxin [Xenorhabdus griffiniae]WNH01315.1 SymE family type I addiction module toxin [Xenorhabdus griffiniae]
MLNIHFIPLHSPPRTQNPRRTLCRYDKEAAPPVIHLKGQWLKAAGFDKGCTLTVKIMDSCLVLIPDSDNICAIKQQYQRQQDQLRRN